MDALNQFQRKLSTPEAAAYVGLGKSSLDKLRLTGGGPAFVKIGRRVIYDMRDLDNWFRQHRRRSTSDVEAT